MMLIEALLGILGEWSRLAGSMPWRAGLVAMAIIGLLASSLGAVARAWLEARSDRVAAGPVFALAGLVVFALCVVWWLIDGALVLNGSATLEERALIALVGGDSTTAAEALRALFGLRADQARVLPPGPVHLPLALIGAGGLYIVLVIWAGRTLAELTALEQKPEDVLARERAEQQKAIALALKEGRPMPTAEVVTVPLADDLFGRTFKLLGHWTRVDLVEERFVRWQRPLVGALGALLVLSLPAALAGHLGPAIWAGAAVALDGLRRNLRTQQAAPAAPPKEEPAVKAVVPALPPLRSLIEAVHRDAGPLLYAPPLPAPQPAQISPGTDLKAKRILEELRRELPFEEGLLMHQGLACDAFAARKNVLLATPPLSGHEALIDLLVLYTLLVEGENVLYLGADEARARRAEARLRARAEAARWRWNVHAETIAGRAGSIDLARSQPGLVFADTASVHRDLCGRQGDWEVYLGALGLVVLPEIEEHHGARGAHLSHVLRRLRRAVRKVTPARSAEAGAGGERIRFLATATPLFRDLGRFAERVVGRPFLVLGPEVDGAPQPDRAAYVLGTGAARGDLHPAVQALGEALAQGFAAELFGYEDVLATADVARANELMLTRGVATRGRAFAEGGRTEAESEALEGAQVIIARASASRYAALPLLVSHLGFRAGVVPAARVGALGAGERVGRAAAARLPAPEEEKGEPGGGEGQVTEDAIAAADLDRKVLLLWQPDRDPFAGLLAHERPPPSHPDLKLGCALVADPAAFRVQRAHLRCALAEAEVPVSELTRAFSEGALEAELGPLGVHLEARGGHASEGAPADPEEAALEPQEARVIERFHRSLEPASGAVERVRTLQLSGRVAPHAAVALDASGPAVAVVDRHTGDALFHVERERALAAAYPGRIFIRAGRRFTVMPLDEQDGLEDGRIACEREERPFTTSKIRSLTLTAIERRSGADRRKHPEVTGTGRGRAGDRRAGAVRSLGGASFTLEHAPVRVAEEVLGLRRHGPDGAERDTSLYGEPIACGYTTRAAVLGLPAASFGAVDGATLHALAHLFRVTLPAFVHHREEDMEVAWLGHHGAAGEPAIAFIDAHPGAVGFAEAVTLEVVRQMTRWSLAIVRRCPARCRAREGCPRCLRITRCHAEPEREGDLDKVGADRVLAGLVGPAEAGSFGAPPVVGEPAGAGKTDGTTSN